jgi:hypothetical protein
MRLALIALIIVVGLLAAADPQTAADLLQSTLERINR